MQTQIEFREIPIFRHFDALARQQLALIFSRHIKKAGDQILTFGQPVPGIFIIVEGEVAVSVPKSKQPLATLHRGQCFGEMSLIEQVDTASANITVSSAEVKLIFCSAADFSQLLLNVEGSAHAFYKSAAHLLSSRLRGVNSLISEDHKQITNLMQKSEVDQQLNVARSEINSTGDKVVSKLMEIMPIVESLQEKYPTAKADITVLRQKLEEIFLVDSQNFDRISQQLSLILQHFENLKRVACGGPSLPISGDQNIFKKSDKG